MDAKELRIGNLFQWKSTGEIEIVQDIATFKKRVSRINNVSINDCRPIPLTEEWLLRFGFSCDENKVYRNDRILINHGNWGTVHIIGSNGGYSIPYQHNNQYVHWLQNLHFALTGKELIPKP